MVSDIMAWLGANPRLPRRTLLLMSGVPGYEPILHELHRRGGDWTFWYPETRAVGHGKLGGRIAAAVARDAWLRQEPNGIGADHGKHQSV